MPTDNNRLRLTRRQILGSAGVIGIAGAGAGLGTSAFFSDTETFDENTIAAGNFDLTVDWEEHYSYPQAISDEFSDPTSGLDYDLHREDPGEDGYVGFPDPENPAVWIHEDDIPTYMANTSIEAFPDPDDDGQQEIEDGEFTYNPCEDGANVAEDLTPRTNGRTDNDDTVDDAGEPKPLVSLSDVKPGDFGELTLSYHLCDNPGYVWLLASGVSESENGVTEPEIEAGEDPEDDTGDLAAKIQTAWWYDTDGNNVIDESVGAVDVMLAVDTSGSLNGDDVADLESAANTLSADLDAQADARVGGLTFADEVDDFTGLADGPVSFSGLEAEGATAMSAALDLAAAELDDNGRTQAETFIVMFTDGGPNYGNETYTAGGHTAAGYTGGNDNSTVDDSELGETADVAADIRDDHRILTVGLADGNHPTGNSSPNVGVGGPSFTTLLEYLQNYIAGSSGDYFSADDPGAVADLLDAITDVIAEEEVVFHRGTLADDLDTLANGGIPLDADLSSDFDELSDPDDDEDREPFQAGVTNYVGFAWWLPLDTGNEVQSDSVEFDLGFYAEQSRNNDSPGPIPSE